MIGTSSGVGGAFKRLANVVCDPRFVLQQGALSMFGKERVSATGIFLAQGGFGLGQELTVVQFRVAHLGLSTLEGQVELSAQRCRVDPA
jgi:hypothetical protein